ncbi:MAG: DNA-binding response regulator [Clostridiales bacterium 43-6]|nr:MAG: DNA-binding response regulator [Clostridiales bacterium 43-6]
MYKILIVEDDKVISAAVKNHIKSWGWESERIKDFENVIAFFASYEPQLILMDISLPFFNGYHWCSEIRKISKVPIIFISSASDNMNIVMAMNMGGDDFIVKPFDLNVLTAKVQAMLRRTYDFAASTTLIEHMRAILNINDNSLTYDGEKIELTKNEFKILNILMENKGKIVRRDVLMNRLWETDSYVDENTLTVNITRLRKKLEAAGLENFISTKKGMGYIVE